MAERYEYQLSRLREDDLDHSPFDQLARWMNDARAQNVIEPTAMCLSTVGPDSRPSARMVLVRHLPESGLTFFSNYQSRKGQELEANANACLTAWWGSLERQVRIEGRVEKLEEELSDAYWESRPYESQLASLASPQSQIIESREALAAMVHQIEQLSPETISRPPHWGGYRLVPDVFEFWQGGPARLHDRLRYRVADNSWIVERLAP